jgi:regulator of CtrA degradation
MLRAMSTVVITRTYDEALTLLIEAKNYLSFRQAAEVGRMPPLERLKLTREAFRVTSRLTQVLAWLMLRRAVIEGEIPDEDARQPERRLAGHDVCLGSAEDLGDWLPAGMDGLLERSRLLYERVARLDRLLS